MLADTYTRWSEAFRDNPAPLFLYVSNWFASEEVQEVVSNIDFSDDDPKKSMAVRAALVGGTGAISQFTLVVATQERVFTYFLKKALNTFLGFEKIKQYREKDNLYSELQNFRDEVEAYYLIYTSGQVFSDATLLQLDRQLIDQSNYDEAIKEEGNRFGTWRLYSQPGGLRDRFETGILPKIEEFMRKLQSYSCRPTGNNKDRYVLGENAVVNGFDDFDGEYCPEYTVCIDDDEEDDKVEDLTKICQPVWRCQLTGFPQNCLVRPNSAAKCVCPEYSFCCPNISPLDYEKNSPCISAVSAVVDGCASLND